MNLTPQSRVAIMTHGYLTKTIGKLASGMLRFGVADIIAIIDREHAGKTTGELLTKVKDVPVVSTIEESISLGAKTLIIGIAPPGGQLPEDWKEEIKKALMSGMNLVNPLHTCMNNSTEYTSLLTKNNWIWDMRKEPKNLTTGKGLAMQLHVPRVLSVGSDMAVGKMTAMLELHNELLKQGIRSSFVATGQVGMCISGKGVPLDAVRVDYAAGAIEREVVNASRSADVVLVEGQGALNHPAAGANIALLRGAMPTHLLLCAKAYQKGLETFPDIPIPPLHVLKTLYEDLAYCGGTFPKAKTVGVALNTQTLSEDDARYEIKKLEDELQVPVSDPIRFGLKTVTEALIKDITTHQSIKL